jgi:hypothetical protein
MVTFFFMTDCAFSSPILFTVEEFVSASAWSD